MKDIQNENAKIEGSNPDTTEANEQTQANEQPEQTGSCFGKFDTAEQLLSAYNALESEFTKRCQLIKQLQAAQNKDSGVQAERERSDMCAQRADGEHASPNAPESARLGGEDEGETADAQIAALAQKDGDIGEYAKALSEIPEVMDACIARYKQRIIESRIGTAPTGMAVIVPQKRPRTLAEAKLLVDKMF